MTTLNITLIICLFLSIIFNILVLWYLRRVLPRLLYITRNVSDLAELIINYRQHLKVVYEMETFYGDETLKALLDHTKSLSIVLEDYEDENFLSLMEEEEEEYYQEEDLDEEVSQKEKDVFYAGSRKRDY